MPVRARSNPFHSTPVPEQDYKEAGTALTPVYILYVFSFFTISSPNGMVLGLRIPHKVDHRLQRVCKLLDLARIFRCELVSQPFHLFDVYIENKQARQKYRSWHRLPR